jgi:hypothetical protein
MSYAIETLVFCDDCQDNCGGDDRGQNLKTIRSRRGKWGWIQRGQKDYCPKCAANHRVCGACECEIDGNGLCGCNPADA